LQFNSRHHITEQPSTQHKEPLALALLSRCTIKNNVKHEHYYAVMYSSTRAWAPADSYQELEHTS